MRANIVDFTIVQHDDPIRFADGGYALRNDDRCRIASMRTQRFAGFAVRCGVHCGGAVIQNQNFRILQQGARNAQPLLLPA